MRRYFISYFLISLTLFAVAYILVFGEAGLLQRRAMHDQARKLHSSIQTLREENRALRTHILAYGKLLRPSTGKEISSGVENQTSGKIREHGALAIRFDFQGNERKTGQTDPGLAERNGNEFIGMSIEELRIVYAVLSSLVILLGYRMLAHILNRSYTIETGNTI